MCVQAIHGALGHPSAFVLTASTVGAKKAPRSTLLERGEERKEREMRERGYMVLVSSRCQSEQLLAGSERDAY